MAEKIHVVDDDLDALRLVRLMLQRQGYEMDSLTTQQFTRLAEKITLRNR